jgi:short-subunit dehydrogenase
MAAAEWKSAWITGASSGIGREVALRLARRGVKVAASARSADKLAALAAANPNLSAYPLDVTDPAAAKDAHAAIVAAQGPLDLVVLNAGIWRPLGASDYSAEIARDSMRVNYFGIVNALEPVIPAMVARGRGHIALMASVASYRGLPRGAAYGPSKAAVLTLAEALASDLARMGVRVSVINPGYVDTPMTAPNDFPMPYIVSVETAADHIVRGLERGGFEIAFPWQTAATLKLARVLPYPLYFWFARTFLMPSRERAEGEKRN